MWLTTVTVWLFSREGVAKSPCKCGSEGGIYNEFGKGNEYLLNIAQDSPQRAVLLCLCHSYMRMSIPPQLAHLDRPN